MTDSNLQQKRLAAAAIDFGVLFGVSVVLSLGVLVLSCVASMSKLGFVAAYGTRIVIVLILMIDLALVLGRDLTGGDRSLGKKLMNIRVVRSNGEPISVMDSIKRNVLFSPALILGLVGAILGLIPLLGCLAQCLLIVPRLLAGLFALGAVIWEIIQIVQEPEGVRLGDKMAQTRVTW
jgi:uncharacterized RDD family membrane protein YckC